MYKFQKNLPKKHLLVYSHLIIPVVFTSICWNYCHPSINNNE